MAGMSIDRQKLQELLRDFRTLTGICISFWYHGDEWSVIGDTVYASPLRAAAAERDAAPRLRILRCARSQPRPGNRGGLSSGLPRRAS